MMLQLLSLQGPALRQGLMMLQLSCQMYDDHARHPDQGGVVVTEAPVHEPLLRLRRVSKYMNAS